MRAKTPAIIAVVLISFLRSQGELPYFKFLPEYSDNYEEAVKKATEIKYLDLSLQKLNELPDLSPFINLEWLDISFNRMTSMHPSICKLTKLKYLNISGLYNITSLPECIKNLTKLDTLKMVDMRLSDAEIKKVQKLLPNTTIILKEEFK